MGNRPSAPFAVPACACIAFHVNEYSSKTQKLCGLRAVIPCRNSQCHQICAHKPRATRSPGAGASSTRQCTPHTLCSLVPTSPHPHGITLVYSRLAQRVQPDEQPQLVASAATCSQHPISGAYVNTLCSLQLLSGCDCTLQWPQPAALVTVQSTY